ncbi:hypothetical protein F5Y15DRAFT_424471 [Xylariaceae sp. FL0016]|nr:hypothetical protein F5Y15DRAFT_424471 [Xylariaceae sp. FL0016]
MPDNMKKDLLSVLCDTADKAWQLNDNGTTVIKFDRDGTGFLRCGGEFTIYYCAEFDWKVLDAEALSQVVGNNTDARRTGLLAQFDMELKFTRRATRNPALNKEHVRETAFRARTFNIRMEEGSFELGMVEHSDQKLSWTPDKYLRRLVFGTSPFPTVDDLTPEARSDVGCFSRCPTFTTFVDQPLPHKEVVTWADTMNSWLSWVTGSGSS